MIIVLLLAGCCLAKASEEWINDEESFVFEHNTLFHINKENQIRLLENIQGYLFDNVTKVIFFKHGGKVYSSYDNLPVRFQSNIFFQVFTFVNTLANLALLAYCFILHRNLESVSISRKLEGTISSTVY